MLIFLCETHTEEFEKQKHVSGLDQRHFIYFNTLNCPLHNCSDQQSSVFNIHVTVENKMWKLPSTSISW